MENELMKMLEKMVDYLLKENENLRNENGRLQEEISVLRSSKAPIIYPTYPGPQSPFWTCPDGPTCTWKNKLDD